MDDATRALVSNIKFVAFDTAHLANMSRSWFSRRAEERRAIEGFVSELAENSWAPVLTWHHLEELLKHGNLQIASNRLEFLRSLPLMGWVRSATSDGLPGTVVDLLAWEAKAAFEVPDDSVAEVRGRAASMIMVVGRGAEAVANLPNDWDSIRPYLWAHERRTRDLVAISTARGLHAATDDKVLQWLTGTLNEPRVAMRKLRQIQEALSRDIKKTGDKRIQDADAISAHFIRSVHQASTTLRPGNPAPALQYLQSIGVDDNDLVEGMTIGDAANLAKHRQRLRLVCDGIGVPYEVLKQVARQERVPSCIIQECIDVHAQHLQEHKGSDLADKHLVCLAPYVNACYVDKRTHENVQRAKRRSAPFHSLTTSVRKIGYYADAMADLMERE